MRKIEKPELDPVEVFSVCISKVRNPGLKQRLKSCTNVVKVASIEFDKKASDTTLHTTVRSQGYIGNVTAEEMVKVYTDRMVGQKAPGREFYDKLISAPAHGRCPLCGQRIVTTLDHHLPKAEYPALAVCPYNLVPSCFDCNFGKLTSIPQTSEQETLHPYYDDVEGYVWLKCRVIEVSPPALSFYAEPPPEWDGILSSRIIYHFNTLKLGELYGSHAAEELCNIHRAIELVFDAGGKPSVAEYLEGEAQSRAANFKNSWQTAMYAGLASSDWFCAGGFDAR